MNTRGNGLVARRLRNVAVKVKIADDVMKTGAKVHGQSRAVCCGLTDTPI